MRLHGLAFVIIGGVVAIASWVLTQQGQKMTLFLFTGVAMLVFGIVRLLIDRAATPPVEQPARHQHTHVPSAVHKTGICAACGTRNHTHANFCGHCGSPLV